MISKITLILLLTKCCLHFAAFTNRWDSPIGRPNDDLRQGRLTGGQEAVPHSYPYLVSLQMRFLWVRAHLCGGTILNKHWILTAGHCVPDSWIIRLLPLEAVVGAHNIDKFGPQTQVASIIKRIPHPLYKGGIGPNDIAVLKTNTPFEMTKFVRPVNLPLSLKFEDPDFLKLAGWGVLRTTVFFPDLPGKLQEANVTYIPYDECYKAIENLREDDDDEVNPLNKEANICSGPLYAGIAGCNGDSGGPLIHLMSAKKYYGNDEVEGITKEDQSDGDYDGNYINDDDEKVPVVLGVVSWGVTPCGQEGAPTVYTKVSNYLDFINQNIKT